MQDGADGGGYSHSSTVFGPRRDCGLEDFFGNQGSALFACHRGGRDTLIAFTLRHVLRAPVHAAQFRIWPRSAHVENVGNRW